ncbi:MAG TPA: hypothetical protein VFV77_04395, partial [Gammaproteobacteria bacterium]|nr:hypothetical protein [Gammaproteobacteria bacterium]
LSMTAGGALAITGAALTSTGVVVSTQVPSTSSFGPFLFPLGSHATANVKGDSTVTLSGKTLSINGGHFSTQSAGTHGYSSPAGGTTGSGAKYGPNSVFLDGRIHLLQNGLPLMSVASPLSVSVHTLDITRRTLEVVPQHTATSFGVPVSLSSLPGASPLNGTAPQASVTGSTVTQATDGALGTLQSTGLVVNLVSVAAGGAASVSNVSNQATAFDPALSLVPTAAGSGTACTAFVPQSSGGYRCGSGGR